MQRKYFKNATFTQIENLLSYIIDGSNADNVGIAGIEKVFDGAMREFTNKSYFTFC